MLTKKEKELVLEFFENYHDDDIENASHQKELIKDKIESNLELDNQDLKLIAKILDLESSDFLMMNNSQEFNQCLAIINKINKLS